MNQQLRLKTVEEARIYFLVEIKQNQLMRFLILKILIFLNRPRPTPSTPNILYISEKKNLKHFVIFQKNIKAQAQNTVILFEKIECSRQKKKILKYFSRPYKA